MSSSQQSKRFKSKLHGLIARGPVPSRRAWQDSILTYLTQNCTVSNSLLQKEQKLYFPSPLPVNVVPKKNLMTELMVHEHGDTPLLFAVRSNCTTDVIAALCHLYPDGATIGDKTGCLPLHVAAKQPSIVSSKKKRSAESEISKTISILVEANPTALVARDNFGKTPLHCLLEFYPETRNLATVELFGRIVEEKIWKFEVEANSQQDGEKVPMPIPSIIRKKLPKQPQTVNLFTPASALAIPDTIVGAIPLHYAVKNGISKEIIAYLIKAYPASVCQVDCNHHTPLHWVFGVQERNKGSEDGKLPAHHIYRSHSIIAMLLQRDPSQTYNVATMKDVNANGDPHRTPLHYAVELLAKNIIDPAPPGKNGEAAASCITLKSLQALIDADSKALVTQDSLGQTPLHVLFRTIFELNDAQYKKALMIVSTGLKADESPIHTKPFAPPKVLLDLLIKGTPHERVNPVTVTDLRGLLPLHCAVLALSTPTVLGLLIDYYPKALTYLTSNKCDNYISKYYDLATPENPYYVSSFEGNRTPLHMAYANPFSINLYHDTMIQKLLFYDSALSGTSESESHIKIDASIALKMQDKNGDTPLHLAAKNKASLDRLRNLLQRDVLASVSFNQHGDLPLHLLLDQHFLFVNAELAVAHSGSRQNLTAEFREKVRELAKKQTIATRMAKFKLSGAIFAPTNGWTNDDDDFGQKDQDEMMQKLNLLGMPLINDVVCLNAPCSRYGLLPLHILVAFHAAPYRVIAYMLHSAPTSSECKSKPDGYTALDLHLFRKRIPGEIKKQELDAWKAIRQLLVFHDLFPLEKIWTFKDGGLYSSINDKEFILDCEQQVVAEINNQVDTAYHIKGNQPIEPSHLIHGFLDNFGDHENRGTNSKLSDTCLKMWVFMTCYYNLTNPDNNYSESVQRILSQLDFTGIDMLSKADIPSHTFRETFDSSQLLEFPKFNVENYANVFCKAELYSHIHFAGLYTFTPPANGGSILIHRDRSNQSILVQATQKLFIINAEESGSSWMFTPTSDVRFRSDYRLNDSPVCIKFIKSKAVYNREKNWRTELGEFSGQSSIVEILDSYGVELADEKTKRYIQDRQDERFRKLQLRLNSAKAAITEWINLAQYPYAIVFPLSIDGNLQDVLSRGLVDPSSLKSIAADMGYVLKEVHGKGLIHSSFGTRSILSFPIQKDGQWLREWKLTGLSSMLPTTHSSVHLGAISPSGLCSYESSILPPEMFKKLDSLEEAFYNNYWRAVLELANVNIPRELITPRVDPGTGNVYVVKCYCDLDETTKRSLPPLPYELVEASISIDLWSYGVFLFNMITNGETLFNSNLRMGTMSSIELAAVWNTDLAVMTVQQYVADPVAQDLLIHLLSPIEQRRHLDMNIVLSHPYFIHHEGLLPTGITKALADARDERSDNIKLRIQRDRSEVRAKEIKDEVTTLSRLSIENQLVIANSATEVISAAFDPKKLFDNSVPYSLILLPYKLAKNKVGKLTPTSMTDVELSERLGKQLLDLSKATCFASCMKEFYLNASTESLEKIQFWSASLEKYPIQTAEEILKTFHLDTDHFLDLASKFVSLVRADNRTFLNNPIDSALTLVQKYVTPVTQIFAVNGKAYLYPVDELYGMPIVETKKGKRYPHTFRDDVNDVVHKLLPYMQTCITRMMSESGSVESLVKLIFEGASPKTPNSWVQAAKGLPKVFLKRRMVAEALILREATQYMIPEGSPMALNGKRELDFIHSLFSYIDSGRDFGGLKCVTDGRGLMWTSEEGVEMLKEDCLNETNPDNLYRQYKRKEEDGEELEEKKAEIAELKKIVNKLQKQLFETDNPEME